MSEHDEMDRNQPLNDLEKMKSYCLAIRMHHITEAATWGERQMQFESVIPAWERILTEGDISDPLVQSAAEVLHSTCTALGQYSSYLPYTRYIGPSTDGTITTSGSTLSFFVPGVQPPKELLEIKLPARPSDELIQRVRMLDQELANIFNRITDTFYADPYVGTRNSMGDARTAYDLLFRILAPKNKVQTSPFYKEKPEKIVTQQEQLDYAVFTHIRDPLSRISLVEQNKVIRITYKKLNALHSGEELSSWEYAPYINLMISFITEWVMAIDDEQMDRIIRGDF